jgi:hypothetical protein
MELKNQDTWSLPRRAPITDVMVARAVAIEAACAAQEHRARAVWFDRSHNAILIELMDGRIFGATRDRIPSLGTASHRQLGNLRVDLNGVFLVLEELDLHIGVDALVTRLMEDSTVTPRRVAARQAGRGTSTAKAVASAENGRLGGRPRKQKVALELGQGEAAEPRGRSIRSPG